MRHAILMQKRKLIDVNTATQKTESNSTITLAQIGALRVGMRVFHQQFGEGTILSLEGSEPNQKAVVNFDHGGEKKLLLKFAKLNIIQ